MINFKIFQQRKHTFKRSLWWGEGCPDYKAFWDRGRRGSIQHTTPLSPKKILSLAAKKVDYIFEQPLLLVSFFLFRCGFQDKIEPSWRKLFNLNCRLRWRVQYPRYKKYTFLSAAAVMQVIFFISDCRNSFNCKLKKVIHEQIIIFHSPSNALCSSDEFVQIRNFKHHTFIGMFPLHLVQYPNTELLLMKIEQICKCKLS